MIGLLNFLKKVTGPIKAKSCSFSDFYKGNQIDCCISDVNRVSKCAKPVVTVYRSPLGSTSVPRNL